jgi:hypothetical protein
VVLVARRVQELQVGIQVLTAVQLSLKVVFIIPPPPLRLQALGFLVVMAALVQVVQARVLAVTQVRVVIKEMILLQQALVAQVVAVFLI